MCEHIKYLIVIFFWYADAIVCNTDHRICLLLSHGNGYNRIGGTEFDGIVYQVGKHSFNPVCIDCYHDFFAGIRCVNFYILYQLLLSGVRMRILQ
jgi:hypothetical protein